MAFFIPPNDGYTFANPRRQVFGLPHPFTNYIFKNYTPKTYSKLIQTCNKFFSQNKIIIMDRIDFEEDYNYGCLIYSLEELYDFETDDSFEKERCIIDFDELEANHMKLWITESILYHYKSDASDLSNFLYRFDGDLFDLEEQKLTFEEYMTIIKASKNIKEVVLVETIVKNLDGLFIATKDLLKPLCGVKNLRL